MIFFLKDLIKAQYGTITPEKNTLVKYICSTLHNLYNTPKRYYHTWKHVEDCLQELEKVPDINKNTKNRIKAALYFHDCIDKNELLSAQTAHICLNSIGLDPSFISKVYDLIMYTKHDNFCQDYECLLIADIDLAILGKDIKTFNQYEKDIREEYSNFNNLEYSTGRKEILKNFLYRPKIYYTEYFFTKYEDLARNNLYKLLIHLEYHFN